MTTILHGKLQPYLHKMVHFFRMIFLTPDDGYENDIFEVISALRCRSLPGVPAGLESKTPAITQRRLLVATNISSENAQ